MLILYPSRYKRDGTEGEFPRGMPPRGAGGGGFVRGVSVGGGGRF